MGNRVIIKEIRLERFEPDPNNPDGELRHIYARCVIRSNCYGSQLSTFLEYAAIARQTYPNLKNEDIEIVHFGGIRYAKTFGIEFQPPVCTLVAPEGWQEIQQLEFTR